MSLKVLLINSTTAKFVESEDRIIPIGLMYLGATLKKHGYNVKIVDVNNAPESYFSDKFTNEVQDYDPDLVGIGCFFSGRFKSTIEISKKIKKISPDTPVAMGGIVATTFPKEILEKYDSIDYICLGEGETFIIGLMFAHFHDKKLLKYMDGIAYRDSGKIVINLNTSFIKNLDELPFPDYDLINVKDYYFDTSKWFNPKGLPINVNFPIVSSRSCPNQCTFCSNFLMHGRKWRARSAKNVVDEIEFLYKKYSHRYFSFMDDNFTLSKKRTLEIAQEIINRGLDIQFDTPNGVSIKTLDKEVMDNLTKAGLIRLCVAVESGSEFIRNRVIKKDLSTEKIYDFFSIVNDYKNLFVKAFFIIGFPQETKETLNETRLMINKIKDSLDQVGIFYLVPFVGTEIFEYCRKNSLVKLTNEEICDIETYSRYNESDYPFFKPSAISLEDMENIREELYESVRRRF